MSSLHVHVQPGYHICTQFVMCTRTNLHVELETYNMYTSVWSYSLQSLPCTRDDYKQWQLHLVMIKLYACTNKDNDRAMAVLMERDGWVGWWFCIPRITVLKHSFTEDIIKFIRVFSRACFWLSRTAHLILRSLSLGKRSSRSRAFRSRSLWRHLNRVWDRCCVYKIFKTRVSRETQFWIAPFCVFQNRVSKQCLNLWLPFIRFCKPQNTVSKPCF